jgi:hypothetical protein
MSDRVLYVEYMGFSSFRFTVNSGIPQGSNLGPLLFLLIINDINEIFTVDSVLYPDDLKLYSRIHNMHECIKLQTNVDLLSDWCSRKKLLLNKDKCISVSYSRKYDICRFDYKIDNHTLSSRSSTKDLGIWFDSRLVFDVHISSVVAASLKLLGFLFRSWNEFRSEKCLTALYFSLVRSRLEYGSIIWSPYYVTYTNSIESVQRKFLKYLCFKEDGTYPSVGVDYDFLCSRFNFTPLKVRRVLDTVTFLFKLFHNKVDCSTLLNGLFISVPQISSRSHRYFYVPRANTNILNNSPSFRMCSIFNYFNDICDLHTMPLPSILVVIMCNLDRLHRLA